MATDDPATPADGCPLCKSAGWLVSEPEINRYEVIRCGCMTGQDRRACWQRARALSDLEPDMETMTLSAFTVALQPAAYRAAVAFATEPRDCLMLVGGPGLGKTHLLAGIANRLLTATEAARWPVYCVVPRLLDRLRSAYGEQGTGTGNTRYQADAESYLDRLVNADVLLLDDLGAERETDWTRDRLYVLLDSRYRGRRPTAIASNLLPTALPDRLSSRLQDRARSVLVTMTGRDYRQSVERGQEVAR